MSRTFEEFVLDDGVERVKGDERDQDNRKSANDRSAILALSVLVQAPEDTRNEHGAGFLGPDGGSEACGCADRCADATTSRGREYEGGQHPHHRDVVEKHHALEMNCEWRQAEQNDGECCEPATHPQAAREGEKQRTT